VKDGPLAFFGVTAPLHKPMRALMEFLGTQDGGNPLIPKDDCADRRPD